MEAEIPRYLDRAKPFDEQDDAGIEYTFELGKIVANRNFEFELGISTFESGLIKSMGTIMPLRSVRIDRRYVPPSVGSLLAYYGMEELGPTILFIGIKTDGKFTNIFTSQSAKAQLLADLPPLGLYVSGPKRCGLLSKILDFKLSCIVEEVDDSHRGTQNNISSLSCYLSNFFNRRVWSLFGFLRFTIHVQTNAAFLSSFLAMNLQNLRLRLRLSETEDQLLHIEAETHENRRSSTAKLQKVLSLKERQRRLNNEKTSIEEALDLITYPILSIPVEITSEIFLHCLPDEPQLPSVSVAPMLLGAICRDWRSIAHGDPQLWNALKIATWNSSRSTLVQDWLLRAGSTPFSLTLIFPRLWDRCSCPFFRPSGGHCPSLGSSVFTDTWKYLTSFRGDFFIPTESITLLSLSPMLVRCELMNVDEPEKGDPATAIVITHPLLTNLTLASDPEYKDNTGCLRILRSLNLPRLRTLNLSCSLPRANSSLLSFLARSPEIQKFTARLDRLNAEYGGISSFLSAMPSVTTLSLHLHCGGVFLQILSLLTNAPLLPHVQSITFSVRSRVSWEEVFADILVNALTSRWEVTAGVAKLLDFEFNFTFNLDDDDEEPDIDEIVKHVWELTENGMNIHVGPPEASWFKRCIEPSRIELNSGNQGPTATY
ncbi:hypothetical protein DFH09DRAFT_1288241 [Mycena vulgaris]|nr:hypothetical protein DFH09DRAFT_1288241 [Mycena vulgaris]